MEAWEVHEVIVDVVNVAHRRAAVGIHKRQVFSKYLTSCWFACSLE
jgi:hypothetical protein